MLCHTNKKKGWVTTPNPKPRNLITTLWIKCLLT
jgi:hypothetical protein